MIPQPNIAVMFVCLGAFVPMSAGQSVSQLTIDGMPTIIENTALNYKAVACLADGTEQDVTAMTDWWMVHHADARIDEHGRLTAGEVDEDQSITIWASFTNGRITRHAARQVRIVNVSADEGEDPWPEYQRTASRLGRTSTIGPQTPTIAWSIQFDFSGFTSGFGGSTVMDSVGRIFVPAHLGLTCVDSVNRQILWEFLFLDGIDTAPTIWNGRVLFGSPNDMFYCVDAATGEEIWSAPALPHPNRGQVVDDSLPGGVVYYPSESDVLYARLVQDGSLLWSVPTTGGIVGPPSLDGLARVIVAGVENEAARAHATKDGETLWVGPGASHGVGPLPVENGRVYSTNVGSPGPVYCINTLNGEVIWAYEGVGTNNSAIALGHDGTVYIAESWGVADLIAISPEGEELWRYDVDEQVKYPPIVAGDGTIYFCSFRNPDDGHVHAVRPDGTALWVKEMPDYVQASPMLAPDGTLYIVCRDKYLYAFKDPDVLGDLDANGSVGAVDLLILLTSWGPCPDLPETCPADLDLDGNVGATDLLILLVNWG